MRVGQNKWVRSGGGEAGDAEWERKERDRMCINAQPMLLWELGEKGSAVGLEESIT